MDGLCSSRVDVRDQATLRDLLADDILGSFHERILGHASDRARRRKLLEESEEPVAARVAREPFNLREIERQLVGAKAMPELCFGL